MQYARNIQSKHWRMTTDDVEPQAGNPGIWHIETSADSHGRVSAVVKTESSHSFAAGLDTGMLTAKLTAKRVDTGGHRRTPEQLRVWNFNDCGGQWTLADGLPTDS
jgi:hypothetical protein